MRLLSPTWCAPATPLDASTVTEVADYYCVVIRRGPQQILRGDGGKGVQDKLQEGARAALAQMLKEGQGDHILLLRLYQVRECVHVS